MQSTSEMPTEAVEQDQQEFPSGQQLPGVLTEDLLLAMSSLSDLTLISSDGERISAVRFILAARSKVFERMLYGNFKEGSSDEVPLSYNGVVLKGIVEFCCTDKIDEFRRNVDISQRSKYEYSIRTFAQIYAAALYFDLKKLGDISRSILKDFVDERPSLACTLYDESSLLGMAKLEDDALSIIILKPRQCLLTGKSYGGYPTFGLEAMQKLVKVESVAACTLFEVIRNWTELKDAEGEDRDITVVGKELAAHLNLCHISPKDLLGDVADSNYVEPPEIMYAMKEQTCGDGVYVAGAGTVAINGKYERSVDRKDCYWKDSKMNGEKVRVFVHHAGGGTWQFQYTTTDDDTVYLYTCFGTATDFPPSFHWKTSDPRALEPPPTIICSGEY